jgi:hypothetical protein
MRTWQKHSYVCRLGLAQPPAAEGVRAKCSKLLCIRNKDVYTMPFRQEQYQYMQKVAIAGPPVPDNYNVMPPPRTVALLPCLPLYIINLLEVAEAVVRLHPSAQPTRSQLFAHCFLSFLNPLLLPVRFLGLACTGHKRAPISILKLFCCYYKDTW